jgi:hypothetical protein
MRDAMRIALLIPITSRRRKLTAMDECDVLRLFLPSFVETATWEEGVSYDILIGIDDVDPFYGDPGRQRLLLEALRAPLANRAVRVAVHTLEGTAHAPCWSWNELFARAHAAGADYFYQMGDDVRLVTAGWARAFSGALESNPALPGLGVTGPLETVAKTILTQAFVSRVHRDVFGTFYPSTFRNWWSDDWITRVYAPEHLFVREDHLVDNVGGIERYEIDRAAEGLLDDEVSRGKERLAAWLSSRRRPPGTARGAAS